MVAGRVRGIEALSKMACKYPQSVYYGFSQSLQAEWTYFSRCVPDIGQYLAPVKTAIRESKKYNEDGFLHVLSIAHDVFLAYVAHANGGMFSFDPLNPTESNRQMRHTQWRRQH